MASTPLFPPYLNLGSYGGAVDVLHMLLEVLGHGEGIVPDLQYGEVTSARVRDLQSGLVGIESDGNFGPATRAALKDQRGLDVDAISWAPQNGVTFWFDPEGTNRIWPEHKL